MIIGISKEIMPDENLVAATPQTVGFFRQRGFIVLVATKAGEDSHFSDNEYTAAGVRVSNCAKELYTAADIIRSHE